MPGLHLPPQSMLHTAVSDRALQWPLKTNQSTFWRGPAVEGNSYPHFADSFVPDSQVAPSNRPPTPPPDMNGPSDGIYLDHGQHSKSTASSITGGSYGQQEQISGYGNLNTAYSTSHAASRSPGRPHSPKWHRSSFNMSDHGQRRKTSSNAIVSYLQIPPSINNSKGSLAEFAAQVGSLLQLMPLAGLICY